MIFAFIPKLSIHITCEAIALVKENRIKNGPWNYNQIPPFQGTVSV